MRMFAALALVPGLLAAQAPPADLELATFDKAWRLVYETHFDTTFNGVNWRALGDSLRPRALGAPRDTVRALIRTMLSRLGQSHFSLITADAADEDPASSTRNSGTLGLDARLIEGRMTVVRVEPGGAADQAGVRPGWIVTRVGGHGTDSLVALLERRPARYPVPTRAAMWLNGRLTGPVDSAVAVEFLDGSGQPVTRPLVRQAERNPPVKWGHFPAFFPRFSSRELEESGTRVGVLWFNNWLVPLARQVDSAMDRLRTHDGIVIDLRGNTGGTGAMVNGIAGHFTSRPDTLGVTRMRTMTLVFVANPRRATADGRPVTPFAGPVAILTDELSGSASEVFAGGMKAIGRVRVFGSTTLGGVLPATWDRLPNGDLLYHALGEFVTVRGEHLEGKGVVPDEPVSITRADLLAGRDPALDAAVRWIRSQAGARTPGDAP